MGLWRTSGRGRRRSGPPDEQQWWDQADQGVAEQDLVTRKDFDRGWIHASMINNSERLDPYGDDEFSAAIRAARAARKLSALDEGKAWRRRRDGALAVCRVEGFAVADDGAHRAVWQEHATACLDAVWRQRWQERDRSPSWIEARWRDVGDLTVPAALDWVEVEDQTGSSQTGVINMFEHLTIWGERFVVTVTVRHDQTESVDAAIAAMTTKVADRLQTIER